MTTCAEVGVSAPTRISWRDPRTRAIVADALELAAVVVEGLRPEQVLGAKRCVRGKVAARAIAAAVKEAWRNGVEDLEDGHEGLQARLSAGHYTGRTFGEQAFREGLRRLCEVCPHLFVRVDARTFRLPLEELRNGGERLELLAEWVDRVRALLYTRAERGSRLSTLEPRNSAQRAPLHSEPSKDRAGTLPLTHGPTSGELERALRDLRRLGPARQGMSGDRRTFVAACIGGDYGLTPETWAPVLEAYSATCSPPWRCGELKRKLASAGRNRKRPFGYKARSGEPPPDPRRASAVAQVPGRRDSLRIWDAACRLSTFSVDGPDGAPLRWLRSRGLDAVQLERLDLARAIPRGLYQAGAEHAGQPWSRSGHTLLVPTSDVTGEVVGVRARWVGRGKPDVPKDLVPHRDVVVGRVLANPAARQLFAGDELLVREVSAGRRACWFVEGTPDFLTMSLGTDDPVIGLFIGAWTAELAARVPTGAVVLLATHDDVGGDALARHVLQCLTAAGALTEARRVRWSAGDVNDAALAGELHNARAGPFAF